MGHQGLNEPVMFVEDLDTEAARVEVQDNGKKAEHAPAPSRADSKESKVTAWLLENLKQPDGGLKVTERSEGRRPNDVWKRLMDGNDAFVRGDIKNMTQLLLPHALPAYRTQLVSGQSPMVAVLSCADSRVSPELIFGASLGELFVVRTAGNTANETAVASLEYAVTQLKTPLVVVMGHSCCGAVSAAARDALTPKDPAAEKPASSSRPRRGLWCRCFGHRAGHEDEVAACDAGVGKDTDLPPPSPSVRSLLRDIHPSVYWAKDNIKTPLAAGTGPSTELLDLAVSYNARLAAALVLELSAPLRAAVDHGACKVLSARYELQTGKVLLLPPLDSA